MIRGTGIDSTVKLYLKGNGANGSTKFFDDSQSHKTITKGGDPVISTSQSKFGGSSIYFDGVGDYLTVPASPDWDYGDKFSMSVWFRPSKTNVTERLFSQDGNGFTLYWGGGDLYIYYNSISYSLGVYAANTWYYLTAVYNTGTFTTYVDGVLKITQTGLLNMDKSTYPFLIGQVVDVQYFNGYIDEFIIQKGVAIDGTKVPTRQRG